MKYTGLKQQKWTLSELALPYASDDKLTFDPFVWPGENIGFRIIHLNTYASISSFRTKTMRSKFNLSSLANGSANSEKVYDSDSLQIVNYKMHALHHLLA